jgi:hypothetical protein
MKLKEHVNHALESLFLAMFMVWTIGITVALLYPQSDREHRGVVEVYSLAAVADANAGV